MSKKSKSLQLNRQQLEKLIEIFNHFKEVQHFDIAVDHSSGIGTGIKVTFDLFEKSDTTVDITDYSSW